jgi:SM-20-related protein
MADENLAQGVAASIEADGYAVVRRFLDASTVEALRARALSLDAEGALQPAAVGRGAGHTLDATVRGDRIAWLDGAPATPAESRLHEALDAVRLALNRHLALGLHSFEGHYALYPPGTHYAPHRDRFRDDDARVLSCVLYLNERWQRDDGGPLRLHLPERVLDVNPKGGTLVAFLSERFVHEVLPATRPRVSVTGWFRRRDRIPGR